MVLKEGWWSSMTPWIVPRNDTTKYSKGEHEGNMETQTSEEKETSSACLKCVKRSPGWIPEGIHHHHSPPSKGAELPAYLNTPPFCCPPFLFVLHSCDLA